MFIIFIVFLFVLGLPTPTTPSTIQNVARAPPPASPACFHGPVDQVTQEVLLSCCNLFRSLCLALPSAPCPTHCLLPTTWLQLSRAIAVSSPCDMAHTLLALPYHCLTRFTRGCTTTSPSSIVIDNLINWYPDGCLTQCHNCGRTTCRTNS